MTSLLIPTRNAAAFIEATLRALLIQDADLEVIVIDDGSTDGSADVVRGVGDDRIRIIGGPQRGISAAFNAGLAQAKGKYLARCDADDLYPPGRLGRQVQWLDERPEFIAVAGGYATTDPRGRLVQDHALHDGIEDLTDELRAGTGRSHVCAYLFRTDALRQVGGCREWFVTSEDADLQYRLACAGRIGYQPIPAYLYRLHDASITHTQATGRRKFYGDVARRMLQQRLAEGTDDIDRGNPPPLPEQGDASAQSTSNQIQDLHISRAWKAWREGRGSEARQLVWRAATCRPLSIKGWKNLVKMWLSSSPTVARAAEK